MKRIGWMLLPLLLLTAVIAVHAQEAEGKADKATEKKAEGETAEKGAEKAADADKAEEAAPEKATLDKKAPDFTLKNANGTEVKLSDYKDKIVVLEWINLDCPWCKKHYEDSDALVKLQKEMREAGVVWLTICSSGEDEQGNFDAATLKKRIKKVDLNADFYLLDADGTVGHKYEARTTPHCYVIDKEGKLRYRGALDNLRVRMKDKKLEAVNYVKQAVDAIKDGKAPADTDTKPYG
ncbi:MAG: redoxin domain-containing protein [Planctomycetes bacterium]|nr:redoxin domain-containing protein [Planctomycetota bacterium]